MSLVSRLRSAFRNLFRRDIVEVRLDEELRSYVDLLTAEKIRAGAAPASARRAAVIETGGVGQVKEEVRDVRAGARIEILARDASHALRGLRRSPGFTLAVVATLTIGIGLNSAIFTLVYSTIARPLPVRNADRIVNVYQRWRAGGREVHGNTSFLSYAEFEAYAQSPAFASSAVYHPRGLSVAGVGSGPVASELVSCDYFRTMTVRMALGRAFAADECARPGSGIVAVLSDAAWRAQYAGDSTVVGRVIRVNGLSLTIIGVTEPGFNGISLQRAAMWVPVTMQPALDHGRDSILVHRNASWLVMAARLAPGATLAEARAQAAVIGAQLDADSPGRLTIPSVARGAYINFPEVSSQGAAPIALTLLLGFTIVAMACANVVNLLLARGLARRREIAIRLAIGASRAQLIQQLLIESAAVAMLGAAFGLVFVAALPRVIRAVSPIADMQVDASPDTRIVAFTFLVAIGSTLLVGLMPALHATRVDLVSAFKGATTFGRRYVRPSRIRSAVVGVQIAGSAMLLVLAGLFLRGVLRATAADPGFATRNVVAFSTNVAPLGYDPERATRIYGELMDRIRATPGVVDVALAARLPLLARTNENIKLDHARGADERAHNVNVATVSGSYFRTMGMRVVRGTTFDTALVGGDRPAVISGSMASLIWTGDAIGERFSAAGHWYRVVGIASEAAASSITHAADPTAYLAVRSPLDKQIIVRTKDSPAPLIAAVPSWARAVDNQLVIQAERFEDRISIVLLPARLIAAETATLGALALVLAVIGIAGVVAFGLGQRRREVAVRLAVGASRRDVVGLMMRQGAAPIVAGLVVGVGVAALLAQLVSGFLFGVSPLDPAAYATVIIVLLGSGALATYLPSRRAAKIDPALTLRDEG